ncbi:PHP domain-containing protein [Chloroflexota bacterium]
MRIDLHCHTCHSGDSLTSFEGLLHWMDRRSLDKVAVTDHNCFEGAIEFHARAPERFVVGEEIKTAQGELIGLFLEKEIPPGLSVMETIALVRGQGGLVGASHPLDRLRSEALGQDVLESIHEELDFLETFNARVIFPGDNRQAHEMAVRWGLPGSAGSDAHAPFEVGRAYVEMPWYEGKHDFLACLAQGQVGGRLSSPLVHFISTYAKARKRLGES